MKLSFFTLACPQWSIDEIIARAREYDYDGIELRCHADGHLSPAAGGQQAAAVGAKFARAGLSLACLSGYTYFSSLSREERAKNLQGIKGNVELAVAVGAPYIRTFGGQLPPGTTLEQRLPDMADCLREAGDYAARRGVKILLETHDDWAFTANTLRLFQKADSPGLGVIWDIYNSWVAGADVTVSYQQIKPYCQHVHVKDGRRSGHAHLTMLGEGEMPWAEIAGLFKGGDYDGYFSFEWEKPWHPELAAPEVALPRAAKFLRGLLA